MKAININEFYKNYDIKSDSSSNKLPGRLTILEWNNLKENLDQCNQTQRKLFYKIAITNGKGQYNCNGHITVLSGQMIVFIHPLVKSSFNSSDKNFTAKYCVFSESFLRGVNSFKLSDLPVFATNNVYTKHLNEDNYQYLLGIFNEIKIEHNSSSYKFKEHLIQNKIFDIIHYTQKISNSSCVITRFPKEDLIELFLRLLEEQFDNINIHNPIKFKLPSYFAMKLNTTVDYLNRIIKKETGKTTNTFIHKRIVEEANFFLQHKQYNIKEIAWCLNFKETSHFINFYKKHTSQTPQSYRAIFLKN